MGKPAIGRRWLPLNALRAFEGVAKHGSFTAAAHALLVSQSALSRHVIALETLIGTQLFERRPHALALTKAGQHLVQAVNKSFDRLEFALEDIRNEGSPGHRTLRVQMAPSFAMQLAVPILRDFRRTCAEVEVDLISPSGVGMPMSEIDVAVIYSKPMVTPMVADLLWPVQLSLLCHPALLRAHQGKDLATFLRDNELIHVRLANMSRHHLWAQFIRHSGLSNVDVERGVVFDTVSMAVQYALSGEGVALVDEQLFGEEIRSGQLVKPFDSMLDDGYGYYLVTQPEALGDAAISLFRNWMIERFCRMPTNGESTLRLAVSNE